MTDARPPETPQAMTRDQALALVGRHLLAKLEDVMAAHKAVVADESADEVRKGNARLVIGAAEGLGRLLWRIVKGAERPRILRPERSLRIVR